MHLSIKKPTDPELNRLLDDFACIGDLETQKNALSGLIKKKAVHYAREDERLQKGISGLAAMAQNNQAQESRLLALAAISRIGTVKSLQETTQRILAQALKTPLSSLDTLKDPDDRYYVAMTLRHAPESWAVEYIAKALVNEKQAESTRETLAENLILFSKDLAHALQLLSAALKDFIPETKNPGDSSANRLARILAALRPKFLSILIEPGEELGKEVQALFQSAFIGVRSPETPEVYEKAAEETAAFVHDIARTQLYVVTDPSLYAALIVPIRWFPSGYWQVFARSSPSVQRVIRYVQSAITLLAKQNATDNGLMEQLIQITGSKDIAKSIASQIAEKHPEFNPDIKDWLRNLGRVRTTRRLSAMDESNELSSDSLIATLMLDIQRLEQAILNMPSDVLDEFRILEPELAGKVETIIARSKSVAYGITSLGGKRNLHIRGSIGEVVEYSASIHELLGGHVPGIRKVIIQRPVIERITPGGTSEIVLKGLVESANASTNNNPIN